MDLPKGNLWVRATMGNAWVMGALSTAIYFVSSPTAAIRKHIRPHRLPHPVLSSFSRPIVCLSSLLPLSFPYYLKYVSPCVMYLSGLAPLLLISMSYSTKSILAAPA